MIIISTTKLSCFFFVLIRTCTLLLLTPIEAIKILPFHVRFFLIFILSIIIVSAMDISKGSLNNPLDYLSLSQSEGLLIGGIVEFCNGLILSLAIYAAFTVFQIAGQLIDAQMGLNSIAILNPTYHSHDPLSSRLLGMLGVLYFFSTNGHHQLLQGISMSFSAITPGKLMIFNGFSPLIKQFSLIFSLSIMLASPLVVSLLIVDISGAILTRNMPQISAYFLALPIKILLGLFIFGLMLPYINPIIQKGFELCFNTWGELMA